MNFEISYAVLSTKEMKLEIEQKKILLAQYFALLLLLVLINNDSATMSLWITQADEKSSTRSV